MTDYKQLCAELISALDTADTALLGTDRAKGAKVVRDALQCARAALAKSEGHIGYPSYEQIQRFMFEAGFKVQDPDVEPAFPRAEYMKLAARIVDWTLTQ